MISYLLTTSTDVEVGNGGRTRPSEDRVVGEAGHASGCHQQGRRNEAEGGVYNRPLHHPPPLHQVADQDGEAHDGHTGQDTTSDDFCINLGLSIVLLLSSFTTAHSSYL